MHADERRIDETGRAEARRVRAEVEATYRRAATAGGAAVTVDCAASDPGRSSGCCGSPTPAGVAAKVAGYASEELSVLPADAVERSFGCGNPLAFGDVREGQTVLDLGSGAGIDLLLAARRVGPAGRVIGVDMTDAMIARARRNVAAAGAENVEIRKGLVEELPVENASVDWVISNCVLNLSPEKHRAFAEIARVLRPGGRMRVSDIVLAPGGLPAWLRDLRDLHGACVAGAIDEGSYVAGLRAAGLVDVEVLDRIHYDASQVGAFLLESGLATDRRDDVVAALAGRVWSATIAARRAG